MSHENQCSCCNGMTAKQRRKMSDKLIRKNGFLITAVMPEGEKPGFCYTIGLTETHGKPEMLIVSSTNPSHITTDANALMTIVGTMLKGPLDAIVEGEVANACPIKTHAGESRISPVRLVALSEAHRLGLLGQAIARYGDTGFTAVRVVIPDVNGDLPSVESDAAHFERQIAPVFGPVESPQGA